MSDELLTIAQTALRLHVSERTLRRRLRAPELQAKLVASTRQVGGRTRIVMLVDSQLFAQLIEQSSTLIQQAEQQVPAGAEVENLGQLYQRLLAEQAARIADLQTALDHERQQSRRHADAATRAMARLDDLQARLQKPKKRPWLWRLLGGKPGHR